MGLSAAERNRRKRQRKKLQKEIAAKSVADGDGNDGEDLSPEIEADTDTEYVPEEEPTFFVLDIGGMASNAADGTDGEDTDIDPAADGDASAEEEDPMAALRASLRAFYEKSSVVASDEEEEDKDGAGEGVREDPMWDDDEDGAPASEQPTITSARRKKKLNRMSVAELKRSVRYPELVEAADVTSPDPVFLLELKGAEGGVEVPRHWCMKRKYLQGKRGVEKPPFALPDFISRTGITTIRSQTQEEEGKASLRQRGRSRAAPKMGRMDVDYRVLHDAFFKFQTKPPMTGFGDLYYEGKEYEKKGRDYTPGVITDDLKMALGMESSDGPPPWLINMQRYGPPPSYPNLKIPGVNAPIPEGAQYGYHPGGWGKPPVDAYGRPLYGDVFGRAPTDPNADAALVTSDGRTVSKSQWGQLPDPADAESSSEEEESEEEESDEEMEGSDDDAAEAPADDLPVPADGTVSVLPPGGTDSVLAAPTGAVDLRKGAAADAAEDGPQEEKALYTVLSTAAARQEGAMFSSDHVYVMPGAAGQMVAPAGAESMLSKGGTESVLTKSGVTAGEDAAVGKKRKELDEEEEAMTKKFKF